MTEKEIGVGLFYLLSNRSTLHNRQPVILKHRSLSKCIARLLLEILLCFIFFPSGKRRSYKGGRVLRAAKRYELKARLAGNGGLCLVTPRFELEMENDAR